MSLFRSRNGGGAGNASAARWAFSVRASAPLDHCGSSPPRPALHAAAAGGTGPVRLMMFAASYRIFLSSSTKTS